MLVGRGGSAAAPDNENYGPPTLDSVLSSFPKVPFFFISVVTFESVSAATASPGSLPLPEKDSSSLSSSSSY